MKIRHSSWFQHLKTLDWNVAESCKLVEQNTISKEEQVKELQWALECIRKMSYEIEKKLSEVSNA